MASISLTTADGGKGDSERVISAEQSRRHALKFAPRGGSVPSNAK